VHRKDVLSNGLRVVTEELPQFRSVSLGVWLGVGSRDETPEENGLTHFLEHMAFKGTPRRGAVDIAREIDQVGGSCNAFTTKEHTCFHGKVLAAQATRLVDLLGDLALHPLCRAEDLEKERQVILEEIFSQDDNPEDLVQVLFARNFYGGHAFGRPILGEADGISRVSREDLLTYREATYRPETTVVAAAGRVSHDELVKLLEPAFQEFKNGRTLRRREPAPVQPAAWAFPRDLEQVQVCLGTRGPAADDPRRFAATMLHILLGGNMSSRLFQVIREQLGLAYSIYSFISFFSDTGFLGISAGVSPRSVEPLLAAVSQELKRFKGKAVSPAELESAREYIQGSIYLSVEDVDHLMMRLAKNELYFGRYFPVEDIVSGLMSVTAEEIQDLANEFLQAENWGLALLGPVEGEMGGLLF
jgi:predicted Zn-dependent peptidase